MAGDIAAAGALVERTMLARAVEPGHGGGHAAGAGTLCLNCGTRLVGAHCHRCGQSGHVHRTVGAIGHEIAHGVFHFEGKIWRTLPMLAFRPGELTHRYVHGERARFVSPMAIFLFSVFLLFAVVAQLPGWHIGEGEWMAESGLAKARAALVKESTAVDGRIADATHDLARERAASEPDTADIAATERKLATLRTQRADLIRADRLLPSASGEDEPHVRSNSKWLMDKWRHARQNPQLLLYKVKSSAYKFSWALIPISLPFIWLLFPLRRHVGMYDHAVFATYSLSFMSLLAITLALLGAAGVGENWLMLAGFLIPPLHIYKQLKGAYRLSRAGALWRTWWMLNFIAITTSLFVLMLLYLGTSD